MPPEPNASSFSKSICDWQRLHGRHDLPWQNTRDPYAIWISEIMLQQTQVNAVIPYYQRFMARFPSISSLANAQSDEVMQHWSGLGYYSRARNLHQASQIIMHHHDGQFPEAPDQIVALPGIGRSTAAAIAAFGFGHRTAILDGNVKRVLTRSHGISGWPGNPAVEKALWTLAESLLPESGIEAYTQGLMDLGATVCKRSKPDCINCPLQNQCAAHQQGLTKALPTPKPRRKIPERQIQMLLLLDGHEILLEKRPPQGIWGGLWSLPEVEPDHDPAEAAKTRFGLEASSLTPMPALLHTFTHFRLMIKPWLLRIHGRKQKKGQGAGLMWVDIEDAVGAALPAPVRKLLQNLSL